MRSLFLGITLFIFFACGQQSASEKTQELPQETPTEAEEDELILRLSGDLVANPQTQAETDQNAIVNYAIDEFLDVQRTSSGLYYQILEEGEGDLLAWADRVRAHYRGYFLDGKEFDSSYRRDKPMEFYIGNVVPGWNEGLQLLRPEGKARLLIPSHLGYGEEGLKDSRERYIVPPNKVLIFELEVLKKL